MVPKNSIASIMLALLVCAEYAQAQKIESDLFHFTVAETPTWVAPVELPAYDRSTAPQGQPVHYLLTERQVLIEGDTEVSYRRMALMPVVETGLEDVSELEISFNPEYEELTLHAIVIHRGAERISKLEPDKIRLIQREKDMERRLYDGVVSALVILEDVRVGDIIEYAFSVKGINPVFAGSHFSAYPLGWEVPVERVSVRVVAPTDRRLTTRTFGIDLKPRIAAVGNNQKEYRWQLDKVSGIVDEGEYPNWHDPYPWLQVSEYRSWREVDNWAQQLYRYDGELDPMLKKTVEKWRGQGLDKKDAVRLALQLVQEEVRYFGVELGQNSHRPSHPNDVYTRRYGDCKDKALLLTALLREFGVEAYPALVSTTYTKAVADWLPSPGAFDHVIVMADIDGKRYWMDGTRNYQRGRLDNIGFPNFGAALVVGQGKKGLIDIVLRDENVPTVTVEEKFTISAYNEPVDFTVVSTYTGSRAEWQRYYFANNTRDEISRRYLNYYAHEHPGIKSIGFIELDDDQDANVFTVTERYRVPKFIEKDGDRLFASFSGSTVQQYTALPKTVDRTMPLGLEYPVRVTHRTVLQYPEDIDFNVTRENIVVEDEAIRFLRHSDYADKRLVVEYEYSSKSDVVQPENIASHIERLREINDNLHYSTWVTDSANHVAVKPEAMELVGSLLNRLAAQE